MNSFQLMAKPTGSICNLDCQYCFYLEKPHLNQRAMTNEVLEAYIKSYIETTPQQQVTFLWQGGEPTLAGLDFYKRAVNFQHKYANGKQIENSLQTNGVLLNADWCRFLHDHHFLVGLSIDGPKHLHDTYRLTKNGKGSFQKVINALDLLYNYQVSFNTLTVVHTKQKNFGTAKSFLSEQCKICKFRFACHGGCPKHRTIQGFGKAHNQLCEAYYSALSHMDPYLKSFAKSFGKIK